MTKKAKETLVIYWQISRQLNIQTRPVMYQTWHPYASCHSNWPLLDKPCHQVPVHTVLSK